MAYTRRGFKGGAKATTLNGALNDSATTIPCSDVSTWAGASTNGPAAAKISAGNPDEEIVTFTGISVNSLTGVTRGQGGTTAQAHASAAAIEHTSMVTDFDEANAHIADTTLDHHTQYARTNGSRTITGSQAFSGGIDVSGTTTVGYTGGEVRFPTTTAGALQGFSTLAAGSPRMLFDHRAASNTGDWAWRNGTNAGTAEMLLDGTGQLQAKGATSSFGAGVFGAASAYTTIGNSGGTALVQAGHGTLADVYLALKAKGTGGVQLQDSAGVARVTADASGNVHLTSLVTLAGGTAGAVPIGNVGTVGGTPTGGGILYVTGGALTYKGSSGTVTVLGAA